MSLHSLLGGVDSPTGDLLGGNPPASIPPSPGLAGASDVEASAPDPGACDSPDVSGAGALGPGNASFASVGGNSISFTFNLNEV